MALDPTLALPVEWARYIFHDSCPLPGELELEILYIQHADGRLSDDYLCDYLTELM